MNGGAYGAGKAISGQGFDAIGFLLRPHVMVRLVCWVFSVVIFSCISTEGWTSDGHCQYDGDDSACNAGNALGVIGFLVSSAFLVMDALFDTLSSVKLRRRAVLLDLAFSGIWSFVCFVASCYIANAWRKSRMPPDGYGLNNLRAAVVFHFFSIPAWGACCYMACLRYRDGTDASQFMSTYDASEPAPEGVSYDAYTQGDYSQTPFSQQQQQQQQPGMMQQQQQQQQTNPFQTPSY